VAPVIPNSPNTLSARAFTMGDMFHQLGYATATRVMNRLKKTLGNFFRSGLNPRIPQFGQLLWVTLPGHDCTHDRLPGEPAQIANHVR